MIQKTGHIARIHPLVKPIRAVVSVPGSKSFTNRALVIAALARGNSLLSGYSDSTDSALLAEALRKTGMEINAGENISIKGNGGSFKPFKGEFNVGDAGTAMRFMTALCCLIPGETILKGSERMHQRPIKELVDGLRQWGADITYVDNEGYPPIKIKGGKIKGGKANMSGSVSSQFISAMLMIAPLLSENSEINIIDEQVSEPYIGMTIAVMKHFGVEVSKKGSRYSIKSNSTYKAANYSVEGDASSATYLFAIAALTQSKIRVNNIPGNSLQSDVRFVDVLEKMGCKVNKADTFIEVEGASVLNAVEVNMQDMPDAAQTLAVVAAFAKGETVITGLKTLQIKESKRITAVQTELSKMGIECSSGEDFIKIKGGKPHGAFISTYSDHRMAMAFAVAGTRIEGLTIESPEVVKKSFPAFWEVMKLIGINTEIE